MKTETEIRQTRRIRIDDVTEEEAAAIEKALTEQDVRVFAITVGMMQPFSVKAQRRMLKYVASKVADENGA